MPVNIAFTFYPSRQRRKLIGVINTDADPDLHARDRSDPIRILRQASVNVFPTICQASAAAAPAEEIEEMFVSGEEFDFASAASSMPMTRARRSSILFTRPPVRCASLTFSVSEPECLSRIRRFSIPDPTFFHPGSASKNLTQKMVSKL